MQFRRRIEITGWISGLSASWRESLFWLLLLSAFGALGSTEPRRQIAGLVETCAFLVVAISSTGRLKSLGLEFAHWNRVDRRSVIVSALAGLVAGGAIVCVASISNQPLGVENGWNKAILAVSLGPVLEEVIFRGYLFTAALSLTGGLAAARSASLAILGIAVLFSVAHMATPGITALQLCCIGLTGSVYGYTRFRFRSAAAAALAHGMYNLTLYLSYWSGVAR